MPVEVVAPAVVGAIKKWLVGSFLGGAFSGREVRHSGWYGVSDRALRNAGLDPSQRQLWGPITPSGPRQVDIPRTPGINPNAPTPTSSSTSWPSFIPGSIFWGSKGPTNPRGRPPGRIDPTDPPVISEDGVAWGSYGECVAAADANDYDWFEYCGPDPMSPEARGPMPAPLPTPVIVPALGRVLSRLVPWVNIFWPSETSEEDVVSDPDPLPLPRGPGRRPRIDPRTPAGYGEPPMGGYRPFFPDPMAEPQPGDRTRPRPRPRPRPESLPERQPEAFPAPNPTQLPMPRLPTPHRLPLPRIGLPALLPFLPLLPGLSPRPRVDFRPGTDPAPLTPGQPGIGPLPLSMPQPQPTANDRCVDTDTKPKRKKRKARDECYRGTYIERRNGLIKHRREKIRCQ